MGHLSKETRDNASQQVAMLEARLAQEAASRDLIREGHAADLERDLEAAREQGRAATQSAEAANTALRALQVEVVTLREASQAQAEALAAQVGASGTLQAEANRTGERLAEALEAQRLAETERTAMESKLKAAEDKAEHSRATCDSLWQRVDLTVRKNYQLKRQSNSMG